MSRYGVEHHSHKLTPEDVRAIRKDRFKTLHELGDEYHVSYVAIWKAKNWVSWAWLDPHLKPRHLDD